MTPEEKAKDLVDRFREYAKDLRVYEYESTFSKKEETENATQCAIIAVEEILNLTENTTTEGRYIPVTGNDKFYWNEVLNHLKNKS